MLAFINENVNTINLIAYFIIGLVSSFYGSITGGAGMLSIPALLFMGVPVEIAIATIKLGDLGRFSLSTYKFVRSKKVVWKYAIPLIPIALTGGLIGAKLLTLINREQLSLIIGIVILMMVSLIFLNKQIGVEQSFPKKKKIIIGYIVYFVLAIYGASIQIGSGPMVLYAIMWFFGLTIIQANATSSVAWLFITISSLVSLIFYGYVDFYIGIPLLIGSSLGGYLGASTAVKKGDKWTKKFFVIVILIMGFKILYESIF